MHPIGEVCGPILGRGGENLSSFGQAELETMEPSKWKS